MIAAVANAGLSYDNFSYSVAFPKTHAPSPGKIAAAIQAAKEAASHVTTAQHRVNHAKEDILHQQEIVNHKQNQAALALQKTEAFAAIQHQQAKSAASALVQAQERLARAKAEVAQFQKIAAIKEAQAAAVIHKAAAAAAREIHKNEKKAEKFGAAYAAEDWRFVGKNTLTATGAAVAATVDHEGQQVTWMPLNIWR